MARSTLTTSKSKTKGGFGRRAWELISRSGLLIGLGVLFALLALFAPNFLDPVNLFNVLRVVAFNGMVACAMTFMIISGDIDVSVGSALAWASALLGTLAITLGWPLVLAVLVVLVVGVLLHMSAALIRIYLNVPSFVVTLSMYISLRGQRA